jgi:hypothetical protein
LEYGWQKKDGLKQEKRSQNRKYQKIELLEIKGYLREKSKKIQVSGAFLVKM